MDKKTILTAAEHLTVMTNKVPTAYELKSFLADHGIILMARGEEQVINFLKEILTDLPKEYQEYDS